MHITSPLCGAVNLNWSLRRRKTAARVFMVAQERGGHASLSAGIFAILILWRARLSGRDVRVQAGRPNLSHVFPLPAAVQQFVSSIFFYICPLSWFKARLSAYSSACHPSPSLASTFTLLELDLTITLKPWGVEVSEDAQIYSVQISRGQRRYRASHTATPILSRPPPRGHAADEGWDVWRWLRREGLGEEGWVRGGAEWGWHHLYWMAERKSFPPQGQGANLFISLPEVTMKFYAVLCSDDERDQRL